MTGKIECNNSENMVKRLCDPLNSCNKVNGKDTYNCINNTSPFIGFDSNNKYEVITNEKNACWTKIK